MFFFANSLKIDRKVLLIFLSLIFYVWWNIFYLPIIVFSILINYFFYKKILKNTQNKKKLLLLGVFVNILILVIFKYTDFIIENINTIFLTNINYLNLPFPLGISFITFQSIAFLINVYDEEILDVKVKEFFLFIVFFPQLIAGPIVKYKHMMPQFNNKKNYIFNSTNFNIGLIILFIGLIKKIYFADTLGEFVDKGYDNIDQLNLVSSWLVSLSFTFQFYFDFTGYVDMATGSALMLNIVLPQNFNSPLKSLSIINFWQRWHITLTQFLNNFIYNPILRSLNNINFFNSMVVTLIVFFIAGLWHGPSWNYVVFGLFHGVGLVINHTYKLFINFKIPQLLAWFLTFNFVNISFIFFRSEEISNSLNLIKKMFLFNYISNDKSNLFKNDHLSQFLEDYNLVLCFILSVAVCFFFNNAYKLLDKKIHNS
jgi:alginate O-acetyltransferase complex protein AlgI